MSDNAADLMAWSETDAAKNSAGCHAVAIAALHERLERSRVVIGDCTLYCEDCEFVLPTLGRVDVVFSDPPYGDDATHSRHLSQVALKRSEKTRTELDFSGITGERLTRIAEELVRIANRWVVFSCEWKHAHLLDEAGILVRLGIWRKPDGAPQFTGDRPGTGWEAVAICHRSGRKRWNGGGTHAFWSVPKGSGKSGHPTEKPLALLKAWIRDFSEVGEVALDPFMGSGTTGVACVQMGRKFIGIERERRYFDAACRRIEEAYAQPRLDLPEPPRATAEQTQLFD